MTGPRSSPAPDPDRLARAILSRRVGLRRGETVTIEAFTAALPWAAAFVREARRRGARPLLHFEDEASYWEAVDAGRLDAVGTMGRHEEAALAATDVYIHCWGPLDQARTIAARARWGEARWRRAVAFNPRWYEIAGRARLRGVRLEIAWATDANASLWGVDGDAWRREVYAASVRDPAALRADARTLARRLSGRGTVRVRHPNGTDLTLSLVGRTARIGLGSCRPDGRGRPVPGMQSVPDATVYVAVDERTAEGTFAANRTHGRLGAPVTGGVYEMRGGRLVSTSFRDGGDRFARAYRGAPAGRDRPAFLEIGLDPALRTAPRLEESERGAVTFGIGGNAEIDGATDIPFSSYLTLGGADVFLNGRPIVRKGRIVPAAGPVRDR
ncbi:MAG: hypothetical protein QXG65_05010 [Thermoplasmata archaeon]